VVDFDRYVPSLPGYADSAQGFAEQALGSGVVEGLVCEQFGEYGPDLALAKAQVAQARMDLDVRVDDPRVDRVTVGRAVSMPERRHSVSLGFDDEFAAMAGAVMR
jgi:hypothetical protein